MTGSVVYDRYSLLIALAISTVFGAQPGDNKTIDQLCRDLSDGSAEIRARAAAGLSELGYEAIPACGPFRRL
jgi:hypothetical protein